MTEEKRILFNLQDVGVLREGRWLIRHIDLQIKSGEIITIVGPNGSGKSTLLNAMTAIIDPDEGTVQRADNLQIGYVPQKLSIDATMPMTVKRMMKLGGNFPSDKINEILDKFQIEHLADNQVQSLSGGEFQRLLIARALISTPNLLVLDEPGQGVDIPGQLDLYEYISAYREETGAGVVLVSHDLHLVMAATDRVVCMNGHICCSGTPQSVADDPRYLELLGNHASRALAVYQHNHDHVHLPDGRVQHKDGSITSDCHPRDGHHHD